MKNTPELITCNRCKLRREPVVKHGGWCRECWDQMIAESDARLDAAQEAMPVRSSIFDRQDGRLD